MASRPEAQKREIWMPGALSSIAGLEGGRARDDGAGFADRIDAAEDDVVDGCRCRARCGRAGAPASRRRGAASAPRAASRPSCRGRAGCARRRRHKLRPSCLLRWRSPYGLSRCLASVHRINCRLSCGDQQLHDLVGAAIDALDAGVAVHPGDRIFIHIAIAAVQLQAFVDDFSLQVRQPVFRHRRRDRIETAGDVARRRNYCRRRGRW